MSRSTHMNVPDGIYYVHMITRAGGNLFYEPEDIAKFERLVAAALKRCAARVHAYCWMEKDALFAFQITDVPLGRVLQMICGPYANRLHRKMQRAGSLFARPRVALINGDGYLRRLVRYVHFAPVTAGLVQDPTDYVCSSHRAYLRFAETPWLTTATVFRVLPSRFGTCIDAYRNFMSEGISPTDMARFECGDLYGRRPGHQKHPLRPPARNRAPAPSDFTLKPLIDDAAEKLAVSRAEILSPSRRRRASCARALVAWHATRSGIATLGAVAQYFGRHPSSLSNALYRYSEERPELFR